MPDLSFDILSASPRSLAVIPTLIFKLRVINAVPNEEVYSAALNGQILLDAIRRSYDPETQERLLEVFGKPARWDESVKPLLWTYITVPLPRFAGTTVVDVPVPCGEDMQIAAGKYFYMLREGIVPLLFLFSGTLFYKTPEGLVQTTQLPWEKNVRYKLPVKTWRDLMENYYPNTKWLRVSLSTFDKLEKYKAAHALPTYDACLDRLLDEAPLKEVA